MEYYIDTAVWVALVRKDSPHHKMAEAVFKKAYGKLIVSFSHLKEMRTLGLENKYKEAMKKE